MTLQIEYPEQHTQYYEYSVLLIEYYSILEKDWKYKRENNLNMRFLQYLESFLQTHFPVCLVSLIVDYAY